MSKGLAEKPINSKSKGYGNLGPGKPKRFSKAHGNEELEWAEDAQGNEMGREDAQRNEMGQGSPKVMKQAKEAQNSMNTSPMIILGH